MTYLERHPSAPLARFVESIWYTSGYDLAHRYERVFPNGRLQIIINLGHDGIHVGDNLMESMLVTGIQSKFMIIDTSDLAEMMGIVFRPTGFYSLFNIPASELENRHAPLSVLKDLRLQLQEAATPSAKLTLLECILKRLTTRARAIHPCVQYALGCVPAIGVAELSRATALSPRRLCQLFNEQVGTTPKHYCRIQRFQRTIRQLNHCLPVRWTELALDCGYFDQSHFIHDFTEFSGITPGDYRSTKAIWMNHRPLV